MMEKGRLATKELVPRRLTLKERTENETRARERKQRTARTLVPVIALHAGHLLPTNRRKPPPPKLKYEPNPDDFNEAKWRPKRGGDLAARHGHARAFDHTAKATERHWPAYNAAMDPHLRGFRAGKLDPSVRTLLDCQRAGSTVPRSMLFSTRPLSAADRRARRLG